MQKWIVRAVFGGLFVVTLIVVSNMNLPKGQAKMYVAIASIAIYLCWYYAESILRKRRIASVLARLAELGFVESPDTPLHYAPERKHHSFKLRYCVRAYWRGLAVHVAEYEYTTGMGKSSQKHEFLEARVRFDRDWPPFLLERRKGFMNRPLTKLFSGSKVAAFGAFGDTVEVVAEDPELTARLLGPNLRDWLAGSLHREAWCMKDGEVSCTRKGACEPRDVEAALGRLAMFLAKARE